MAGTNIRMTADKCSKARLYAQPLLCVQVLLLKRPDVEIFTKFYVEIKCQLDATEVFIADLIACSTCFGHHYAHHQELKSIIR